jgi:hypothetical protein
MTINGKPIAIMACLQMCAVFLSYTGGILGMRIVGRLYGAEEPGPVVTQNCIKLGLWPLLVPIIWSIIVIMRTQRDASNWELIAWFIIAIIFCVFVGGSGLMAPISPFVCV